MKVSVSLRDLRWYWLGLQIPMMVLAMHFAPQITAAVQGPEKAALERTLKPVIFRATFQAVDAICRAAPAHCPRNPHA